MENRNYGVDLLRIVLMYMIVLLHVLGHGGILGKQNDVISFFSIWSIEELCICSVNCFALISGYFAKARSINYKKIIKLWLIAFYYSAIILLLYIVIRGIGFNISNFEINYIKSLLPVLYGNWYFSSYFFLFFLTPFINKYLNELSEEKSKYLLILFIFVYSFLNIFRDFWQKGLSTMWLLILYIIGALLKKSNLFKSISKRNLFLLYLLFCIITFFLNIYFDFRQFGNYSSPTVLMSAIFLLLLFSKIKINKYQNLILFISKLTFGVYLFHDNSIIVNLFIKDRFLFINSKNVLMIICFSLIVALIIFIISLVLELFRFCIFKLINIDNKCDIIINFAKKSLYNIVTQLEKY